MRKITMTLFLSALILCTSQVAFSATPAIDLSGFGVTLFNTTSYRGLDIWVKVIDHDGIDSDSHEVKVCFPDSSTEVSLYYQRNQSPTAAFYYAWYPLDEETAQHGDYTFQVKDPENNVGEVIDYCDPSPLDPPDKTSFTPGLWGEFITASFDNVIVDGSSYDDFSLGTIDPSNWQEPFCSNAEVIGGELKLSVEDTVGVGKCPLRFLNPESISDSIKADITLDSVSSPGNPNANIKARIAGYFFNNGVSDIWSAIQVYENRVKYFAEEEYFINGFWSWKMLSEGTLLEDEIELGDTVTVSISWDGANLKFDATFDTIQEDATYSPSGHFPLQYNKGKSIEARIHLNLYDNSPTFTWDPVTGANRYRIRIYRSDGEQTIWNGYPSEPSYRVPPGVLATNTSYRYRIDAFDAHDPLDVDNISKAPASNQDNFQFYTSEIEPVDPYIEFGSVGVHIWNNAVMGPYLSFWIKVHDAQGVPGNIKSVTVQFPNNGPEEVLYYYYQQSPTCGIYRTDSFLPIQNGTYTFRVEDKGGHVVTLTEDLTPADPPLGCPAETSLSPVHNTVINDTEVNFDWADVPGAAFYRVEIYDKYFNRIYSFATTEHEYNLPAGFLKENTLYRYRITARAEFFSENVDNSSSSPWLHWMMPTFMTTPVTGSSSPLIDLDNFGVYTAHITKPGSTDPIYWLAFEVNVSDPDGVPENIQSVSVTYPDDTTRDLIHHKQISPTEARYLFIEVYDDFKDIQEGEYKFKVTDFDGNESGELTDNLEVNLLDLPTNCMPLQDSTVIGTTPTIDWDDVDGALRYRVSVYDGRDNIIHRSDFLTESTHIVPEDILEVGQTYNYRISAYREEVSGEDIDNASIHPFYAAERYHFTIGNTETGSVVEVHPVDTESGETPVTITFDEVTDPGTTSLTTSEEGAQPPLGFMLGEPPTCYDITTTAEVSGPIEVCIDYSGVSYDNEEALRLYHYENGNPIDVTTSLDTTNDQICGSVSSLSLFVILEPPENTVKIDIKPGSYPNYFNQNEHGVIPVAIFGSAELHVNNIDLESLSLRGLAVKMVGKIDKYLAHYKDVNEDGYLDLVIQFEDSDGWWESGNEYATLSGVLSDGTYIYGRDTISIVP